MGKRDDDNIYKLEIGNKKALQESVNQEVYDGEVDPDAKIAKAVDALNEMADLGHLREGTTMDIPPDKVLAGVYGKLSEVVIAGVNKDGKYVFASSAGDGGNVLWLVEQLKMRLLGLGE